MADDEVVFTPLYPDEDETTILERWRGWANEGLDPATDVDEWTDTREGSHWWNATTPMRREVGKVYDLMGSEVPMSIFPQHSWGEYLDDHGELRNLSRLSAVPAAGVVTFEGEEGTVVPAGTVVGVVPETEDAPAPEFTTDDTGTIGPTGLLDRTITATAGGDEGVVAPLAIRGLVSAVDGVTAVSNAAATFGGTDTESDTRLAARITESFEGSAVANQLYYRRVALDEPGVGLVTVVPVADGPGTIAVIVSTALGGPVNPDVVASLQARLDPYPQLGLGEGQTNAAIVVSTADSLGIDVAFPVEFEPGFSLDGEGGTIALRSAMLESIAAYIGTVEVGEEVVRSQVAGRVVSLRGVHDIGELTLNGATDNVAVPSSPPKRPTLGSLSPTAGTV